MVELSAGQRHESKYLESVVEAVPLWERGHPSQAARPDHIAGDKGYSIPRIRAWLKDRGIRAVIAEKEDERRRRGEPQLFDRKRYRRRNVIERCVGWLKECRRVATRFEKLAVNFLAMIKLAMIRRYLKTHLSDTA